jgi:hypothetical protein
VALPLPPVALPLPPVALPLFELERLPDPFARFSFDPFGCAAAEEECFLATWVGAAGLALCSEAVLG